MRPTKALHVRRLAALALASWSLGACEIDPIAFGGGGIDMFVSPDGGFDLGVDPRDFGPLDIGPDLPPVPCATVTCTAGQVCVEDECVDRTCAECSASERCEPAPVGTGVVCLDNTCADDVACPEDRFCGPAGLCEEDTCVPGTRACTPEGNVEECPPNGSATEVRLVCRSGDGFDGSCRESAGEVFCGCRDDWDCPANTECIVDRCVGTGLPPTCLLPPADITTVLPSLEPGFPWGGEDDDRDAAGSPFPASSQVVVTPIVINLDDDNDDGRIDERDIPEILFMTFCDGISGAARYQQHGILRAVHGGGPDRGRDYFATCNDTHWLEGDDPAGVSCSCTAGDLDPTSTLAAGDLDGDGVPEIVVAGEGNAIRIFDNAGRPLAESAGGQLAGDNQALVLVNVDGRGNAEIVSGRRVLQVLKDPSDGTWSFGDRWLGTPALSTGRNSQGPISCVADLTGDGLQDVIAGTTLYRFPGNPAGYARQDECDGAETGDQAAWCAGELPVEWNADDENPERVTENGFCAIADVWGASAARPGPDNPLDGVPEVVVVNDGQLQVFRGASGELLLDEDFGDRGGAPNVDDFDGDGFPEIGTAFETAYLAYDLQVPTALCPAWPNVFDELVDLDPMADPLQGNPARMASGAACASAADCGDTSQFACSTEGRCVCLHNAWQRTTQDDSSRVTGSSVFDFNGDGAAEVIYNDECYFRLYRGLDGTVIFREPSESRTRTENPVVADVDSDGNAEIVFAVSNESNFCASRGRGLLPVDGDDSFPFNNGLEVWGEPSDLWVSARRIYNQHAYGVTNVYESGGLPLRPRGGWEDLGEGRSYNTFRSQPRSPFGIAPDLQVAAVQFSSADSACGELTGALDVVARIVNAGDLRVGGDVPVALVGTWSDPVLNEPLRDGMGAELRVTLGTVLEARGERFLSLRYDPANNGRADLPDRIEVIVDPDEIERECFEDNNRRSAPVAAALGLADLRATLGDVTGPCPGKTFTVTVFNDGTVPASGVLLRFYAGDPAAGGTAFHDERLAETIPAGGSVEVRVDTSFPSVSARAFVVVDALGEIEECNDGNNTGASDALVDCSVIII
ncbi:MAG: FG-GAP-like repeat-containing protein [Myxococcota bacterium]